jgi:hypothetical protein
MVEWLPGTKFLATLNGGVPEVFSHADFSERVAS